MKKPLYNALSAVFAGCCVLVFSIALLASGKGKGQNCCESLSVAFSDSYNFVNEEDIKSCLDRNYGPYVGQRLDSVDLYRIEEILDAQSAVLKSEAYTTPDGRLNVIISQREPAVRFQKGGQGFYADNRGMLFPLQSKYTSNVPVVDGAVPLAWSAGYKGEPQSDQEKRWLGGLLSLLSWVENSKQWSGAIVQMNVNQDGDLVLVPRYGSEKFIFGYPDEIAAKFGRIEKYYQYIRPSKGEDYYSTVNVKFDGQIVCRK